MSYRNDLLTPGPAQRASSAAREATRRRWSYAIAAALAVELVLTLVWSAAWAIAQVMAMHHPAALEAGFLATVSNSGDTIATVGMIVGGMPFVARRPLFRDDLSNQLLTWLAALWCGSLVLVGGVTLYALAVR